MPNTPTTDVTRLTVELLPASVEALNSAASRLGDTHTDTINQALRVYNFVTDLTPGERVTFERRVGERVTLLCASRLYSAGLWTAACVLPVMTFVAGTILG